MTRLRLEADIATGNVVKDGRLKIVIINPGKDSQEWRSAMANYPYDWEIGSAPDAAKEVDLRRISVSTRFLHLQPPSTNNPRQKRNPTAVQSKIKHFTLT